MCGRFENKVNENIFIQLFKEMNIDLIVDDSIKKNKKE